MNRFVFTLYRYTVLCCLALFAIGHTAAAQPVGAASGLLLPRGYLSTRGSQIVDASGQPVRIAAVGWPGGDSDNVAPIGLNRVNYRRAMDDIKALDPNTIRLPWCNLWVRAPNAEPLRTPRYIAIGARYNPDLVRLTALQVTDKIVAYAGRIGLKIMLDHHNNDRQRGQQANGLWFDRRISVAQFEQDWLQLARRYKGNDTVIGFDLDIEPLPPAKWDGGGEKDWHAEATRLGNMLQAINSGPLIIATGIINLRPAPNMPDFAPEGNLQPVRTLPVVLKVPNKVVYTIHEYPPSTFDFRINRNPATLVTHMNRIWGASQPRASLRSGSARWDLPWRGAAKARCAGQRRCWTT